MMSAIIFAATAIGVQRTILSVYTTQLTSNLSHFVILAAAISLSVFGFAKAIGNYIGGKLSDMWSRVLLLRIGLLFLVIGSFLILFSSTLIIFLVSNLIIGVGVGIFLAASTVMFSDVVSSKYRAGSISLMELSVYGGTSIGSILTGFVSKFGYIYSFVAALILVIIAIIISIFTKDTKSAVRFRNNRTEMKRIEKIERLSLKWKGFLSDDTPNVDILDSEDIDNLTSQIISEPKENNYDTDLSLKQLFHPSILFTISTGLISRISDTAIILILPLLILERGFSGLQLGLITSIFTIMWAIGMYFSGPLADQVGRKVPVVVGLITEFTGLSFLILPTLNQQFVLNFLGIIIAGLGRGTYYAVPASILADQVNPEHRGRILGIYRFILDFGYVIGSFILVILVEPILLNNPDISEDVFEATFLVIIFIIVVQALFVTLLLKDPKPSFRQYDRVKKHLNQVKASIQLMSRSIVEYSSNGSTNSRKLLHRAKIIEQKADRTLEQIIYHTYSGSLHAVDAIELLEFSQKMDKALGHMLRGLRQIHMVKEDLPSEVLCKLSKFAVMTDFMVLEIADAINLLPIKVASAAIQSYHVNWIEEILDEYHQSIWDDILNLNLNEMSSILFVKSVESLEMTANTIEDAAQIIRLIAIKHNIR